MLQMSGSYEITLQPSSTPVNVICFPVDPINEWRLRYVTAQGLMLIRHSFANDSMRNGLSTAADALLKSAPVLGSSAYCRGQPAPAQQEAAIDWLSAAGLTHVCDLTQKCIPSPQTFRII